MKNLGLDCVLGVGGAIHGHPMGGVAGAKAMRQAMEAALTDIPLEEYAKMHKELRVAIDKWGIYNPEINIFKSIKD